MRNRYEKAALQFSNLSRLDKFLERYPYEYTSHTFNPGVVCSYNNLMKYDYTITDSMILIKQLRKTTHLLLGEDDGIEGIPKIKDWISYSEKPIKGLTKKIKEVVYDLSSIFMKPSKEVRRGIHINERKDVVITDYKPQIDFTEAYGLYEEWVAHKNADPKVFRISFSPQRYANSLYLQGKIPNMYSKKVYIKDELYGILVFHLNLGTKIAYELTFISKFWDTNLKLINDLNFCLLINCFHDLYSFYEIRQINVGTDAGIKGLKLFKNKIAHSYNIVYSV